MILSELGCRTGLEADTEMRSVAGTGLAPSLVWRSGAYSPQRPQAAGMRPLVCSPHEPPPAPMLKSRSSPGSDARHRSPDVILGFAEYAFSFPIYIRLSFSLFAL
jgi:hypothetical protein